MSVALLPMRKAGLSKPSFHNGCSYIEKYSEEIKENT
jgi:hypothetical protein